MTAFAPRDYHNSTLFTLREYLLSVKKLLLTEPPNPRIWVWVITTESFGSVRSVVRGWTPDAQGVFTDDLNRARHPLAANFEAKPAGLTPTAAGTDIFGGLWQLKPLLESGSKGNSDAVSKTIWIFSFPKLRIGSSIRWERVFAFRNMGLAGTKRDRKWSLRGIHAEPTIFSMCLALTRILNLSLEAWVSESASVSAVPYPLRRRSSAGVTSTIPTRDFVTAHEPNPGSEFEQLMKMCRRRNLVSQIGEPQRQRYRKQYENSEVDMKSHGPLGAAIRVFLS